MKSSRNFSQNSQVNPRSCTYMSTLLTVVVVRHKPHPATLKIRSDEKIIHHTTKAFYYSTMTSSITLLILLLSTTSFTTLIHAFSTVKTYNNFRHPYSKSLAQQPQPNFGDWTNDDYLNNLGGNGDGSANESTNESGAENNYTPPQNELTDEEITAWALNAASFYNTESSVEEVYGVKREGPPRREEGSEVDGWDYY